MIAKYLRHKHLDHQVPENLSHQVESGLIWCESAPPKGSVVQSRIGSSYNTHLERCQAL